MNALPKELFTIIGNFLDDESRKIARLVNIQWFNSIKYDEFNFEFTTEERFEQICKRLMNYKCMIGIGFDRSNFEFRQKHFKMLGQLTQLTKLECDKCNWQKDEEIMAISNLTNLEVVDVAGRSLPESVLRQLTNLKIIYVTGDDLKIQRSLTNLEAVKYAPDYRDIVDVVEADSDFLSNLRKMTRLKVTAPIREETLNNINGHFIKYTNLKRLSLINMHWEEHDWFEWDVPDLPNLENLKLYEVSEIASISMANTKLTRLELMADSIIDCSVISPFTNLVNLELRGRITSTFALDSLTRLKTLKLKFANATSTAHLTFLSTFNNLELFEIGYNRGRRNWNDALLYFSENNNLTSIRFFGAENSFGYLTKFEKLRSLDCGEIDHRSTQYMTVLTNLTLLNIAHMTPKMFLDLGSLTTLKKLYATIGLNDMNADDKLVIDIGRLPNLEDMVFSSQYGIDVTKIELTGFDKLAHLRKLHVDWPIITESVFAEISHCTALRDLEVRADISDASILSLSTLTNLRALRLTARNNDFTGVHLTCLTRLTCLRSLRVFANETKVVTKQDLIEKMPLLGLCDV